MQQALVLMYEIKQKLKRDYIKTKSTKRVKNTMNTAVRLDEQGHPTNLFLPLSVPQRNSCWLAKYYHFCAG